jgi:hypothetical protein
MNYFQWLLAITGKIVAQLNLSMPRVKLSMATCEIVPRAWVIFALLRVAPAQYSRLDMSKIVNHHRSCKEKFVIFDVEEGF